MSCAKCENQQIETLTEQLDISQRLHQKEFNRSERYKKAIQESLEKLKRGGSGTRNQVKELLEEALKGDSNE